MMTFGYDNHSQLSLNNNINRKKSTLIQDSKIKQLSIDFYYTLFESINNVMALVNYIFMIIHQIQQLDKIYAGGNDAIILSEYIWIIRYQLQ
jgi:hypothetical protein